MTPPAAEMPSGRLGPSGRRIGGLAAAVWLVFLGAPLRAAWQHPNPVARYLAIGALICFGAAFVLIFVWANRARRCRRPIPFRQALVALAAMLGLAALTIPGTGGRWMATLVYLAATAVLLLPRRYALAAVMVLTATPLLAPLAVPAWESNSDVAFAVILASFTSFGVLRLAERNVELVAAQQEIHRLAVAGERARAARDLHDILGHSLTVIAVKAELAGRLLDVDPPRAAGEVADLERLAREALADVRRTVGAYREVTLTTELASARAALSAAGVAADLPASVADVPPERGELFAWVVREGVTNVVRHSGARRCTIRIGLDYLEVTDDGRGPSPAEAGERGGYGLRGLRERAEQLGAQLTVGRVATGQGFLLRVSLPNGGAR